MFINLPSRCKINNGWTTGPNLRQDRTQQEDERGLNEPVDRFLAIDWSGRYG